MTDKPHFIDGVPASTEEIVPIVRQHAVHNGIAFFPECPACQAAKERGEYPRWFPEGGEKDETAG